MQVFRSVIVLKPCVQVKCKLCNGVIFRQHNSRSGCFRSLEHCMTSWFLAARGKLLCYGVVSLNGCSCL